MTDGNDNVTTHGGREGATETLQLGPPLSEKERQARERIAEDRYNLEAWTTLASEAQSRSVSDPATVGLWEFFFAAFPTAGKWWKVYVEAHMALGNNEQVKKIFGRCLLSCPYLDLWRCYIRYIRQTKDDQVDGRDDIRKAMEFALDHVGLDINAGSLWEEYIKFLKATPAANPQEESQRMGSIRKAYQRAVLCPLVGVEMLWKDYEAYEMGISRTLAKGLLTEYQPRYASARAVSKERKRLLDKVVISALPVPLDGSRKDEQNSVAWAELLAFERSNPQRLADPLFVKSVSFAYDQCLMSLRLHPNVWYDYATWHAHTNNADSAVKVFQKALTALPDCLVLHFAYAELLESRGKIPEAKAIYTGLLKNERTCGSLAQIQMMKFMRRTEDIEAARQSFLAARKAGSSTYHIHVASALMELCTNKDSKVAKNVLELGMKKYLDTPSYVLEYADFLGKMNDERNIRALFERVLSVLPSDKSQEVWNAYVDCERLYGDLDSLLKVEQRKRNALAKENEGADLSCLEEAVARYSFRELLPCSPAEIAHVTHLKSLLKRTVEVKQEGSKSHSTTGEGEEKRLGLELGKQSEAPRLAIVKPDTSQMVVYDPRQGFGGPVAAVTAVTGQQGLAYSVPPAQQNLSMMTVPATPVLHPSMAIPMQLTMQLPAVPSSDGSGLVPPQSMDDNALPLSLLPPPLSSLLSSLPRVPGPFPDVDFVISVLLQMDVASLSSATSTNLPSSPLPAGITPSGDVNLPTSGVAGSGTPQNSSVSPVQSGRPPTTSKRKETEKREEAPSSSAPPRQDVYRWRLKLKAKGGGGGGGGGGGAGSFSGGTHSGGTYSSDRVSNSSG